jgi:hypothetical protein
LNHGVAVFVAFVFDGVDDGVASYRGAVFAQVSQQLEVCGLNGAGVVGLAGGAQGGNAVALGKLGKAGVNSFAASAVLLAVRLARRRWCQAAAAW